MPRVKTEEQWRRYQVLREANQSGHPAMSLLEAQDQWILHDYYWFSHPLNLQQFKVHLKQVAKEHPSLPNRAGKAFVRFVDAYERVDAYRRRASVRAKPKKNTARQLSVWSEVNPEIDPAEMAAILIEMAKRAENEDRDKRNAA